VPVFLIAKLKMPCLPGFFPVMKVVHATGVWAGAGGIDKPRVPSSLNLLNVGSWLIHLSTSCGLAPSKPMISIFIMLYFSVHFSW